MPSQLNHIIHNLDLLAGLERRQANVRTAGATERITERAAVARARLALHGEV